jgi:hypothetical protein
VSRWAPSACTRARTREPEGLTGLEVAPSCQEMLQAVETLAAPRRWYEDASNQRLALRCATYNGTCARVFTRDQHQPLGAKT